MGEPLQILIVYDDQSTCRWLDAVLTAEGYRCRIAHSSEEAEPLLDEGAFHLALLDIYLGNKNGLEFLDRFPAAVAGTGVGNVAETVPTLLNAVIGTKFRIIKGYPAANESMLAMERGEVEGAAVNWTTVKTAKAQWLREGLIKVILQDQAERE